MPVNNPAYFDMPDKPRHQRAVDIFNYFCIFVKSDFLINKQQSSTLIKQFNLIQKNKNAKIIRFKNQKINPKTNDQNKKSSPRNNQ
jgi:hypothetical protein